MSRDAKKQKQRRQRERDFREKRMSRAYEQPKPQRLLHFSYDVSFEPLDDPNPSLARLRRREGEEAMEELNFQISDEPQLAIPKLRRLIEEYPDVPMLYNWLYAAYLRSDNKEAALEIHRINYERHPDYVFAIITECTNLLEAGNVERVTEILDRRFDIKMMYPHRSVFHFTEVMGFAHMIVQYFVKIGELEGAQIVLDGMEQLNSEHPMVFSARLGIISARGISSLNPFKRLFGRMSSKSSFFAGGT